MNIAEQLRRLTGGSAAATADDAPEDMRQHVRAAYGLLCAANRRGIQVPADVVAVVTAARKIDSAELPDDLEARFWNAYGLLSSSIGPAARARTVYTLIFYGVLAVLLFAQFLFLAGDHVRAKMAEADARGRQAAVQVQAAPQGQPAPRRPPLRTRTTSSRCGPPTTTSPSTSSGSPARPCVSSDSAASSPMTGRRGAASTTPRSGAVWS